MTTHAPGTTATVRNVPFNDFGVSNGDVFHLDADRVWRNANGNGVELSDSLVDTYSSYATVDFTAPQQVQEATTVDKDTERLANIGKATVELNESYGAFVAAQSRLDAAWSSLVSQL